MFKIGIRLMAARTVRHFRANMRTASQFPRMLHNCTLWGKSSNGNGRLFSSLRTPGVFSLAAGISQYVRADTDEDNLLVREQQAGTEENNDNVDPTVNTGAMPGKVLVLEILDTIFYKMMDSGSRALLCGIVGANVVVSSAFVVALFLNRQPNPSPTLLRFLSRNFLLSLGWLSQGRWHVLLTSMFPHLTLRHLMLSTSGVFTGIWLCSIFLDVWQIAGLYVGGGLVGACVSMALAKYLGKVRYMGVGSGASHGINALLYYFVWAQDVELSSMPSVPIALLLKGIFVGIFMKEVVGVRRYIRYGFPATGRGFERVDHAGHLGGSVTGLVAYEVSRATENIRSDSNSNDYNETKEQNDKAENMFEGT